MINGIVIIDKPEGITSAEAVSRIKRNLKLKKAGHAGTLDPFATGMLIVCVNQATKVTQYLSILDKVYLGTMVLGVSTDTQDLKGKTVKICGATRKEVNPETIKSIFTRFQGESEQIPPMFSAIKHRGLPLYKLARKGITVEQNPRKINIYQLDIINIRFDRYTSINFRVKCSKGTYIRTLCHDIGEALGVGAYVSSLRRIVIGHYLIDQSIPLDEFLALTYKEQMRNILPLHSTLRHLGRIVLPDQENLINKVKNGGWFSEEEIKEIGSTEQSALNNTYGVYTPEGYLLAIATRQENAKDEKIGYKVERVLV